MKQIILLIVSIMFVFSVQAQDEVKMDNQTQKQLKKEARKNERKLESEKTLALIKYMVDTNRFVLEADYLANATGNKIPVNSTINFIVVDTTHCVIQIGTTNGIGYNGVGGVTTEGNISSNKTTQNKKGDTFTKRIITNTSLGTYDITFFISGDGQAEADISGITPGKLRYYGRLVPIESSRVYKGRNTY